MSIEKSNHRDTRLIFNHVVVSAWPDKINSLRGQWHHSRLAVSCCAYSQLPHCCLGVRCSVPQLEYLVSDEGPLSNVPHSKCPAVLPPGLLVLSDSYDWFKVTDAAEKGFINTMSFPLLTPFIIAFISGTLDTTQMCTFYILCVYYYYLFCCI